MIKHAITQYPAVLNLIKHRWSARSFSSKEVSRDDVLTIIEAGTWAASANNEQPWEFQYAIKGSVGFETIWNCLMSGNQPWNKHAAGFIVTISRKTFAATDKPNTYAEHDVGLATSHILLQASSMEIFTHPMAGFEKVKLSEALGLTENQQPICVIALGYLDAPEKLEEPFKSRELALRTRKGLEEVVKEVV
jgi:nitroreductase